MTTRSINTLVKMVVLTTLADQEVQTDRHQHSALDGHGAFKVGDDIEVQTDCEVEDQNPKVGAGTCTVCVVGMTGKIKSIEEGNWIVSLDDFRQQKRFWVKKDQLQHFKHVEDDDECCDDDDYPHGNMSKSSLHGMQHEVYRSAPMGPQMFASGRVQHVFRSAPRAPTMGQGRDVRHVQRDMCREDTYRSSPAGPQMFSPNNGTMRHFRPVEKEVFRSAPRGQMKSVFRSAPSQSVMPVKRSLNAPKSSGQVWDDLSQTKHSSSQSLPTPSTPQRQDCLTVDQRQKWLDARKAALKRHEDAFKRNEQRMSAEEVKRVRPRLVAERKRLDAEQNEIDDDRKHIPQSVGM